MSLRYRGILYRSQANGPGFRTVLFTQGCGFRCSGCQNPELWPAVGGTLALPEAVGSLLLEQPCDGWTITGGEPLTQVEPLITVLELLQTENRGVILFTGYTKEELGASLELTKAVALCDAVVTGRFQQKRVCHTGLRGSSNQEILCITDRYEQKELEAFPHSIEIYANPPVITGFPGGSDVGIR